MEQWILKEHTSFFLQATRDLNLPGRALNQPQSQEGGVPASAGLWVWTGALWARRPIDSLPGAAGWNVSLFDFPAKMPVVLLEGPDPADMGTPPSPWTRPFGIAVRACLVFEVPRGEESRGKGGSSSDAWVWWAVLSCLPKKWDDATMKMFLCLYSTPEDSLSPARQVTEDKLN